MSIRLLKPITQASRRVLEQLVAGLDVGDSNKFDNGGSAAEEVAAHRQRAAPRLRCSIDAWVTVLPASTVGSRASRVREHLSHRKSLIVCCGS